MEQELLKRCVVHLFVRPWGAVMLNTVRHPVTGAGSDRGAGSDPKTAEVGALCLELIRSPQSSSVKAG